MKSRWEKAGGAPYKKGCFATKKHEEIVKMLDGKAKNFAKDTAISHAPNAIEPTCEPRYLAALQEIATIHIGNQTVEK